MTIPNPFADSSTFEATRSQQVGSEFEDQIDSLPLELLVQISEYLEPADIVRSQRVSKRWRAIFSSEAVTKHALRRTLAFLGLDGKDEVSNDAITYFRWHHGLQFGRPVKKVFLPCSDPMKHALDARDYYLYHSRRVCHGVIISNRVEMLDLDTGRRSTWIDDEVNEDTAGDLYWNLFLSDNYLVFLCGDLHLTVCDIHTSQRWVKVFPCYTDVVCIEKDKMIIRGTASLPFTIYCWDLGTNQVQEIGSCGGLDSVLLWHMDADENILVVFEIDWKKHPPETQQTKWALTGGLLDKKHFPLSLSGYGLEETKFRPRHRGSRTFDRKTVAQLSSEDEKIIINFMYNYAIDKLSFLRIDNSVPLDRFGCELLTPFISYEYNSLLNGLDICNSANGTSVMHPYHLDFREVQTNKYFRRYGTSDWGPELIWFGDSEVLGVVGHEGIQFWFFNPNFAPDIPGAKPFSAMEKNDPIPAFQDQ